MNDSTAAYSTAPAAADVATDEAYPQAVPAAARVTHTSFLLTATLGGTEGGEGMPVSVSVPVLVYMSVCLPNNVHLLRRLCAVVLYLVMCIHLFVCAWHMR
jgi:hypothetical protein